MRLLVAACLIAAARITWANDHRDVWIRMNGTVLRDYWDGGYRKGTWNYMAENPVERSRPAIIAGTYFQMFTPNGSFLDVGGGEGAMSDYLNAEQKQRYTCLDLSAAAISMGRQRRPGVNFVLSGAEEFLPSRKYDMIAFSEMLYYCDHKALIRRYLQFLNPGGLIAVSLWYNKDQNKMGHAVWRDVSAMLQLVDAMHVAGTTVKKLQGTRSNVNFLLGVFKRKES